MRRKCRERFPDHRLQRKPLVSDPGINHGCMSGSLTRSGEENVPGIPGTCAARNFTYVVRGPCGAWPRCWKRLLVGEIVPFHKSQDTLLHPGLNDQIQNTLFTEDPHVTRALWGWFDWLPGSGLAMTSQWVLSSARETTSTVYWCIASKLKAARNLYWMSNMFLWVEIFLFFVCYHVFPKRHSQLDYELNDL